MEEIKTKKKLNKKPLIICLILALVFGIVGFVDLKSNAAESEKQVVFTFNIWNDKNFANEMIVTKKINYTLGFSDYIETYMFQSHYAPTNNENCSVQFAVISKSPLTLTDDYYGYNYAPTEFEKNGEKFYLFVVGYYESNYSNGSMNGFLELVFDNSLSVKQLAKYYSQDEFINSYVGNSLETKLDYDNLPIDDDMLIPENLKRNVITNEDLELGDFRGAIQRYDYITWRNTSEVYQLELQVMPVVQYFQMKLNESKFTKEFYGEWITQEIFDEVTNSYTICTYSTDLSQPVENKAYVDGLNLKSECDNKYSKGFLEENYLNFAYRIRYIDVENEKAGCWLTLVPSNEFDSYDVYVEYADSSLSDKTDGNGLHNEYTNLEDIENAKTDITTENDFKDKYGVTTGDIDTSQATNWLYSVVDFIKTTPQMVGVVLAFLPQPILYGMYITIFLGCIASAIAIVKALI